MRIILILIGICAVTAADCQASVHPSQVVECRAITLTRQGVGSAFKGNIINDDYAFSAKIPDDLTGWSGVAQGAPFHGFTIFLDSQGSACIYFEVHIRVEEKEAPGFPIGGREIHLGMAQGWQSIHEGSIGDLSFTNISTTFSFQRTNRKDDGVALLITPTVNLKKARAVYDNFINSLKFGQ